MWCRDMCTVGDAEEWFAMKVQSVFDYIPCVKFTFKLHTGDVLKLMNQIATMNFLIQIKRNLILVQVI